MKLLAIPEHHSRKINPELFDKEKKVTWVSYQMYWGGLFTKFNWCAEYLVARAIATKNIFGMLVWRWLLEAPITLALANFCYLVIETFVTGSVDWGKIICAGLFVLAGGAIGRTLSGSIVSDKGRCVNNILIYYTAAIILFMAGYRYLSLIAGNATQYTNCWWLTSKPSASSIIFLLSTVPVWWVVFSAGRKLADVHIQRIDDGDIDAAFDNGHMHLDQKSIYATYKHNTLDNEVIKRIRNITRPCWIGSQFNGEKSENKAALNRDSWQIIWSFARLSLLVNMSSGIDRTGQLKRNTKNELWKLLPAFHNTQLRLFFLIIALALLSICVQINRTSNLKYFGHIEPATEAGLHDNITGEVIVIDDTYKAKIKNHLPLIFGAFGIAWFAFSIMLRNKQMKELEHWDARFTSKLNRIGHAYYLTESLTDENSIRIWQILNDDIDSIRIGEFTPEGEQVLHIVEAVFLTVFLEFLHIWH